MGNLGLYQTMTTLAKKVGGPLQLAALVAGTGYVALRSCEAGVSALIKRCRRSEMDQTKIWHTVFDEYCDERGIVFRKGDQYAVLERDHEAVLIEIRGDGNNPYFISEDVLKKISDYISVDGKG